MYIDSLYYGHIQLHLAFIKNTKLQQ